MKRDNKYYISLILKKLDSVNDINTLNKILAILDENIWSIKRKKVCNNEERWNLLTYLQHEDDNKDDPKDPIISYGNAFNYVCYPLSELKHHWQPEKIKKNGKFTRPDYMLGDELPEEFSEAQIKDLLNLLKKSKPKKIYNSLITTIRMGLHHTTDVNAGEIFIQTAPHIYQEFSAEEKSMVYRALAHFSVIQHASRRQPDDNKRARDTTKAISNYFNWIEELPEKVRTFFNSFYYIVGPPFQPVSKVYQCSADGTNVSFIHGLLKAAIEGDYCLNGLHHTLRSTVKSYKHLFIHDISYDQYKTILNNEVRSITNSSLKIDFNL